MYQGIAFLLGGLLLFVWMDILWAFKERCLEKIKSGFLKYSLGMMFAYVMLFLIYVASEHYLPLKTLLLNWYIGGRSWRHHLDSCSCLLFYLPYRERLRQ